MSRIRQLAGMAVLLGAAWSASAQTIPEGVTDPGLPASLRSIGFAPKLDAVIPGTAAFRDETGREVRLGDYYGIRPVLLAFVYYQCPALCDQLQQGIAGTLKMLSLRPGSDYEVVLISFDPKDTPEIAARKKKEAMSRYGRPETAGGWHYLSGGQEAIAQVTEAANYHYSYDAKSGLFAHASGILLLTPAGHISRYFYGVDFSPRDVRLGLVEASAGKIGTVSDHVLLFCFQYDPGAARYSATILTVVRAVGILTVLALVFGILIFRWYESRVTRLAKLGAGANLQGVH
ncbi:MAG: SCO family protein [Acidobacteriia bacterium]|nr:SCO family protein [Terriglobia bacterium]